MGRPAAPNRQHGDDSDPDDRARWFNLPPGAGTTLDGQLYATDSGIGHYRSFTVPSSSSTFNEDDGVVDRTDEIDSDANLIDGVEDGHPDLGTTARSSMSAI